MSNLEDPQAILSGLLIGVSAIAMMLALNETRGIPMTDFFAIKGQGNVTGKFFFFMSIAFVPLAILAAVDGEYISVALLLLLAALQFLRSGFISSNRDSDSNET
jgi:hypothetical protein